MRMLLCPKYDGVKKVLNFENDIASLKYPNLMIIVLFCWKMNFPHNEIKINSVLLMMFLKLTIKVVAFFLGHPV